MSVSRCTQSAAPHGSGCDGGELLDGSVSYPEHVINEQP